MLGGQPAGSARRWRGDGGGGAVTCMDPQPVTAPCASPASHCWLPAGPRGGDHGAVTPVDPPVGWQSAPVAPRGAVACPSTSHKTSNRSRASLRIADARVDPLSRDGRAAARMPEAALAGVGGAGRESGDRRIRRRQHGADNGRQGGELGARRAMLPQSIFANDSSRGAMPPPGGACGSRRPATGSRKTVAPRGAVTPLGAVACRGAGQSELQSHVEEWPHVEVRSHVVVE